uniref:Uncharacterized protein At5g05190 n=1 Tax=Anthurium amnicola TaxID=1678845 RepID=A0A1D1ZCE9_9ARAE
MAGEPSKMRIVRCPKCLQLLTEFADVPVYKCGACGAVLQAKNRHANKGNVAPKMLGSLSSEKNLLQHVPEVGEPSNDVPNLLNKQSDLFCGVEHNIDMGSVAEHTHVSVPSDNPSCSNSENSYHKEEVSPECTENANMEAGLTDNDPCSTGQSRMKGKDPIFVASDRQGRSIQASTESHSIEKMDDSWKPGEHGSGNSCSSCIIEATDSLVCEEDIVNGHPGSRSSDGLVGEEDIINGDPVHGSSEEMNASTATSTHAFGANFSSCNVISSNHQQDLPSSGNEKISESSNTTEKDREEDTLLENTDVDSKPHVQSSAISLKSSDERYALATFDSSDSTERSTSRHTSFQVTSQHSGSFYSAQLDLEDDISSRSLSIDSSFGNLQCHGRNDSLTRFRNLENDRMELLRKVNELRDHLTRPYTKGLDGNQRSHIRGSRQDSQRPLFYNHGSEQVLKYCNTNITQSHSRLHGQKSTAQWYQSSRVAFPGQGDSTCLRHHPKDWCVPVQLPPKVCCRACTCHIYCHSTAAANPRFCRNCNVAPCSDSSQTSDPNFEKLHCKEKRQPFKRQCRPVSGGAPFVICSNCSQLLQLPADFLVSRARFHKLKCGACSELLIFLSHGEGRIVPHSSNQIVPAPSEVDNAMDHDSNQEQPADRSCIRLQGDPVSYSEDYGPPFSHGYSSDGEPVPRTLSSWEHDRRHGKQAMGSLHSLMGYGSASELIYQPSGGEGYESTDVTPLPRAFENIHVNEIHTENRMGSPPFQKHSEIECSQDHTETHKEDRYVKRSTNARGGPPRRGLFKKGMKELNHGLESMKLKLQASGRVIPAP